MRDSGTITLFADRPQWNQRPTSYLLSVFVHGVVIGLISVVIVLRPRFNERVLTEHYSMRHIDLHTPEPLTQKAEEAGVRYPGPQPDVPAPQNEESSAAKPEVARQVQQLTPAPQTLIQPKLPPRAITEKIPLPTVVIWQLENKPALSIVPPLPQKPVVSVVKPSVNPPNEETALADLSITSSEMASKTQPILPSTTSPMVVLAPNATPAPPQTTSTATAEPTPAAVISLSDLRKQGVVVLPPVNESAASSSSGVIQPGRADDLAKAPGNAAGKGTAAPNDKPAGSGSSPAQETAKNGGAPAPPAATIFPSTAAAPGPSAGANPNGTETVERITLPKDGQFGVVVIGSSLDEMYPEVAELWSGRLAYTVYLHVGTRKSWILQYALPPSDDAASAGNASHLAAPWPYNIIRPNLAADVINADALMVHGVVNKLGKFETLAVAFPPRFPESEFVMRALRQWDFRPATRDGKATSVEVLLIIPEED